ncbi:type III pantothenate kinase [Tenuibacillus multivorans]|uniref:Type III pantothenate kinase n=1 Tax=Tenuibacillus multivorans TaxID=237069 RepID=A0A1G9VXP6_9BACI|nr:type III pantothenate kinase [Tenuibacillus multivorans]GEL78240.1 type III pantothenate kinase [Tenuibacillus multivorans]SDM77004.1 type III pantothenate kinase [Tenuibacillus multivorans]
MIFVLDVGNTNTVLGVFDQGKLTYQWRLATNRHKTEDEYAMRIKSLLQHNGLSFEDFEGVIISSVVPPIMFALEKMCERYFHLDPLIVGSNNVKSHLKTNYPNPREIGADRVVNAVGAIKEYRAPLVIIDFGTATTFCYINEHKEYEGGAITPGINVSTEALYSKAAKLPRIEITRPDNVIGKSTVDAIQSGIYFGYVGQVDEVVNRIKDQANKEPTVIATGGLAKLIAKGSKTIDYVDSALTLKGLYEIYGLNKK